MKHNLLCILNGKDTYLKKGITLNEAIAWCKENCQLISNNYYYNKHVVLIE